MHKLGKILLISLVSLLLIVLAGATILIFLISPDRYKDQITQQIISRTGYQVAINGNINWSLFPTFGIRVTDVAIASPENAATPFSTRIGEVTINVQLLPLIDKQIESDSIVLQDIAVLFKKPAVVKTNTSPTSVTPNIPSSSPTTRHLSAQTKMPAPLSLHLHKVAIKNATLNWEQDKVSHPELTIVSFESDNINFDEQAFPFTMKMMLTKGLASSSGELEITGLLLSDAQMNKFELKQIKTSLAVHSILSNGRKLTTKTNSIMSASFPDTRFTLDDLQFELNNVSLVGKVKGKINPVLQANGKLDIKPFNLFEFLQSLGIEINTRDPALFDKVKGSFNFDVNQNAVALDNIHATVDNNAITGNIKLSQAFTSLAFNLHMNQLNLDRVLPPETGRNSVTQSDLVIRKKPIAPVDNAKINELSTTAQKNTVTSYPNNSSLIRETSINGTVLTNKLIWGNLYFDNFSATIKGQQGIINIQPLASQFYGGQYSGSMQIDMRTSNPQYMLTQKLENVSLQNLLKQFNNNTISGIVNASCNVSTSGVESTQLIRNANGTFTIDIRDGKIRGADIMQSIDAAYAQYQQQKSKTPPTTATTDSRNDFGSLNASFQIQNGIARTNNIVVASSGINATGNGTVNLLNQNIDLSLEATVNSSTIKSIIKLQNNIGGTIPIKVTGTLSSPVVSVNYAMFVDRIMKSQINKQLNKLGKKVGLPVGDDETNPQQLRDIGKQLKSLFK